MVTVDDVAAFARGLLLAEADFTAAVPGGVWFAGEDGAGGPDEPAAYPYAAMRVKGQAPQITGGAPYTQRFTVTVAAFAPVGAAGSDPQAVQKATLKALAFRGRNAALRSAGEKVLHVVPKEPAARFDGRRRNARDVFVCGHAFEVLVLGGAGAA